MTNADRKTARQLATLQALVDEHPNYRRNLRRIHIPFQVAVSFLKSKGFRGFHSSGGGIVFWKDDIFSGICRFKFVSAPDLLNLTTVVALATRPEFLPRRRRT